MRHRCLAIAFTLGTMAAGAAVAGPPLIGGTEKSTASSLWSFDGWQTPSFSLPELPEVPTPSLSLPEWPKSSQPGFVDTTQSTLSRFWSGTKRTTRSAWESTKYVLRPFDAPTEGRQRPSSRDSGSWASWFSSEEQEKAITVNDFLKQPTPY